MSELYNFASGPIRADHTKDHMGLTTWADAPEGKIKKSDVTVAKNYLSKDEIKQLNRMVTAYLDFAENMTLRHIPLTMQDWEKRFNSFIEMFDYGILQDAGKVSAEIAKLHAETEFEKYRVIQDRLFMSDFDKYMLELKRMGRSSSIDIKFSACQGRVHGSLVISWGKKLIWYR